MPQPSKRKLSHDQLVLVYALLTGLPAVITVLCILWLGEGWEAKEQWTLTLLIVGFWLGFALALQARVVRPLQTMANLLSALREGDFSVRARGVRRDEPLGDVMFEINTLSRTLQEQRLSALEATALLRTVMEEINISIFAFDADKKLRLANHAAQLLLAKPAERILGRAAAELGLAECLAGEPARHSERPSSAAARPRMRSAGFARSSCAAWLARRSFLSASNAKMEILISSITVRSSAVASSALRRC